MINITKITFGYCHLCQKPSIVGIFELHRWRHTFMLCSNCLRKLGEKIDIEGTRILEHKNR